MKQKNRQPKHMAFGVGTLFAVIFCAILLLMHYGVIGLPGAGTAQTQPVQTEGEQEEERDLGHLDAQWIAGDATKNDEKE